jgi:hypothetical protein
MSATPTQAFTGKSTVLSVGATPTPIQQVKQFSFSGVSAKYEDITCLGSPSVGPAVLEEATPASVSPGTATFSGVYLPSDTGFGDLATAFTSQTVTSFTLQLPMGPGQTTKGNLFAFSGYVQDMPLPDTIDATKPLTFKCTIKLSTVITVTQGS